MSAAGTELALVAAATAETAFHLREGMGRIPLRLSVSIPMDGLRLRSLMDLRPGQILRTSTDAVEDVPVHAAGALLCFAELDNMDGSMAVRLTRLS